MAFVIVILMGISLVLMLTSAANEEKEAREHAERMRRLKNAYRR